MGCPNERKRASSKKKTQIINFIRGEKPNIKLKHLLVVAGLKPSTYKYHNSKPYITEDELEDRRHIIDVFYHYKQIYGSPRITIELNNEESKFYRPMNHKKVERLMRELGLVARKASVKRNKYSSYTGDTDYVYPNLLCNDFTAPRPLMKICCDVTEFHLWQGKLYLEAAIDCYNGEIVAYSLSTSPNMDLTWNTFNQILKLPLEENCLFHTDHGNTYQNKKLHEICVERRIRQSMSSKGVSKENGLIENFFNLLKTEMWFGQERKYRNIGDLKKAIEKYINFYNNKRIKTKLKTSPVDYRLKNTTTHKMVA